MVPLPPLPTPPPNLTELSEEELRAMEGNLRQAVETRIQTLQRVQLLLDAISVMMSQYQAAAATANIAVPTATNNINGVLDTAFLATSSTSSRKENAADSNAKQSEDKLDAIISTPSASNESTPVPPSTSYNDSTSETVILNEMDSNSETETLRRRRLQKFSPQPTEQMS